MVTLSLYGLCHRGASRPDTRLAWTQVGSGALGFAMLTTAMAMLIGADQQVFLPVGIVGAFLCLVSMALFLVVLVLDVSRSGRAGRGA